MDRPEDRRNLTHTERRYPHPGEGGDAATGAERVEPNPEVLAAQPHPRAARSWQNREILGMRALPLLGTLAAALSIPLFLRWMVRSTSDRATERVPAKALRSRREARRVSKENEEAPFPMSGRPRFVVLASRPWGKKGRKARALVLGKVVS